MDARRLAYPFTDTAGAFRNWSDRPEPVIILVDRFAAQGERDSPAVAATVVHPRTLDLGGRFRAGVFGHHMLLSDLLTSSSLKAYQHIYPLLSRHTKHLRGLFQSMGIHPLDTMNLSSRRRISIERNGLQKR